MSTNYYLLLFQMRTYFERESLKSYNFKLQTEDRNFINPNHTSTQPSDPL